MPSSYTLGERFEEFGKPFARACNAGPRNRSTWMRSLKKRINNARQADAVPAVALRIIRTPQARRDLIEIWSYIADDNPAAADKLLRRFEGIFVMSTETPLAGRARPELHPDVRSFPIGSTLRFIEFCPTRSTSCGF